jgi:hypothetical protein
MKTEHTISGLPSAGTGQQNSQNERRKTMDLLRCKKCGAVFTKRPPLKIKGVCQHEDAEIITKDTEDLTFEQIVSVILEASGLKCDETTCTIQEPFFGFEEGTPYEEVMDKLTEMRSKIITEEDLKRRKTSLDVDEMLGTLIDIVTDFVEQEKKPYEALIKENSEAYDNLARNFRETLKNFGLLPSEK